MECPPVAPTLFGLCVRKIALRRGVDISILPRELVEKIENLREEINIIKKTHNYYVKVPQSYFCVKENGELDWPATCARCYHYMKPSRYYIFAAINGLFTLDMCDKASSMEGLELPNSGCCVLNTTIERAFYGSSSWLHLSVSSAAENGWPGATRAWIGLQDERLNNINYVEERKKKGNIPHNYPPDPFELKRTKFIGYAIIWSIRDDMYHMLRYLPVTTTDFTSLFPRIFPNGCVSLCFLRQLAQPPATECRLNVCLINQLEYIARKILEWLPQPKIERLKEEAKEAEEIELLDFIERLSIGNNLNN